MVTSRPTPSESPDTDCSRRYLLPGDSPDHGKNSDTPAGSERQTAYDPGDVVAEPSAQSRPQVVDRRHLRPGK